MRVARLLYRPQNPFVLGEFPDRPAPAHVLNGYVAASLGVSSRASAIRVLLSGEGTVPAELDYLDLDRWKGQEGGLEHLKSDLALVFNPDRRMWEKVGSPVPVHARMATNDPSDDGLGPLLWSLMEICGPTGYRPQLAELFSPSESLDPVTTSALLLVDGAVDGTLRAARDVKHAWFGPDSSTSGQLLGSHLATFIAQLTSARAGAGRLMQIQHLGRGLYLASILALLLGPVAAAMVKKVDSLHQVQPLLIWADTPPGPNEHPFVSSSARSFQSSIESVRASLADGLASGLAAQPLPSGLAPTQRRATAIRSQFIVSGATPGQADSGVTEVIGHPGLGSPGDPGDKQWASAVTNEAFPIGHVTKGIRSMGRKVGFVGPDRGAGVPRFVCETPLLGTLVAGLCPDSGVSLDTFVDLCRARLGLVFGPGSDDTLAGALGLWEGAGIGEELLKDNQEALRRRLVRAGLAREYSDGYTEVGPGA